MTRFGAPSCRVQLFSDDELCRGCHDFLSSNRPTNFAQKCDSCVPGRSRLPYLRVPVPSSAFCKIAMRNTSQDVVLFRYQRGLYGTYHKRTSGSWAHQDRCKALERLSLEATRLELESWDVYGPCLSE